MAYRKNYLDEDQEGQAIGSGGIIAGNAGQGPGQAAAGSGSGWTNLQQYLDANAGETGGLTNAFVGANQKSVDNAKAIGSDLVKKTQADDTWNAPIKEAKSIADQIRTGDVTKIDPTKFGQVSTSSYSKPQLGNLGGYGDALKAFSDAGQKVKNADEYGSQKATLQSEFGGSGNYGSGASTLDTFLLRADPNSKKAIQSFKETNKDYVANPGENSARFKADVTDPLAAFFGGQENTFNSAKADMSAAVADRRRAIEAGVTDAAVNSAKSTQRTSAIGDLDKQYTQALKDAGVNVYWGSGITPDAIDFGKYVSDTNEFGAEDVMSDADWQALAALEGLDSTKSALQTRTRGDSAVTSDGKGARTAIDAAVAKAAEQQAAIKADRERIDNYIRWHKDTYGRPPYPEDPQIQPKI